jgi:ABC-2 type transport system permease protein
MPLRYLVTGSESVLSRGGGVMDVLPTMGGMLLFGAVITAIAWRFFSWDDT